ncbi:class I SAM-dependent methyltransferase [Halorientalis pallida]|uniref:Class I SAM-dependent methyltransferase n=1 Tax=Halorientalis pallida TaxID=2479928 RepID=A0A498L0B1_9EURY|nr:class I SAM-dependent methyltransferase [Halorientalis pallida]RXK51718.1 class I SAM-dependent methyltransferase [Halorientalis pallida]
MDSHEVRRQWADRSGEYSPEYYAYYGPDETSEALRATFEDHLDRDARVLELGCSSGRHLAHLADHGFGNLAGIEINAAAFETMEDTYPDLAADGTFYCDAIEDVVTEFPADRFDAVYSVETLQHIHPDADWVFAELARITADLLVTVENEGDDGEGDVNYVHDDFPLYYRDWNRVFTDLGFEQVDADRGERDTIRTFRAPDAPTDA